MKKNRILSLIVTLAMIAGIIPIGSLNVSAAEYSLTIAGVTVTDLNKADILGDGVFSYNSGTNTLTIDGYCNYSSGYVIESQISGLTINSEWDSTLIGSRGCVALRSDTIITGGRLTIKNTNSSWSALSVAAVKLTINDAELYVDGAGRAISGSSNSNSKLEIIDSYVNSKTASTSSQEGAVMGFNGGITLDGCKIATPEDGYKSLGAIVVPGGSRPKTVVIERTYGSKEMHIGDYLQMGTYYGSPILWRCVDIDENGPLMLSDKIICLKAFDAKPSVPSGAHARDPYGDRTQYGANNWSSSNIRSWLNSEGSAGNVSWKCGNPPSYDYVGGNLNVYNSEKGFLKNFTNDELSLIKNVFQKEIVADIDSYSNGDAPYAPDSGGQSAVSGTPSVSSIYGNYDLAFSATCKDRIFLLDAAQLYTVYAHGYTLGYDYYIGKLSEEAAENCEYTSEDIAAGCNWQYWLRTPVTDTGASVYAVYPSGYITDAEKDGYAFDSEYGIRPAFYLGTSATIGVGVGKGTESSPYVAFTLPDPDPVPTPRPVPTPEITFHTPLTELTEGNSENVIVTVDNIDTTDYKVKWSSSNNNILKVDSFRSASATVTALEPGSADVVAKITVQSKVVAQKSLTITVYPAPTPSPTAVPTPKPDLSEVSLGNGEIYICNGKDYTKNLSIITDTNKTYFGNNAIEVKTYKINHSGGYEESDEIISAGTAWRASGNEYVWVTGNSVGKGAVELRIKNSYGEWCTCRRIVNVEESLPKVSDFTISVTSNNKNYPGKMLMINMKVQPSNAIYESLTYTSLDPDIATVSQDGLIICRKPGQAMIMAELHNYGSNMRYKYKYITIQVHSRDDYKDVYGYEFINNAKYFGYPSDYQFPQSIYEAAGLGKVAAFTLSWAKDWGGNCVGMSTSSMLFYLGKLNPAFYSNRDDGASANVPHMLKAPNSMSEADYNLRTMIELFQVAQYKWYDKTYLFTASGEDTYKGDRIKHMADYIQKDGLPVALSLNTSKYAGIVWESGHTVLLYDYEYNAEGQHVFKIYDPSGYVDSLYFYKSGDDWKMWFNYIDTTYTWYPHAYITFSSIMDGYNYLLRRNVVKRGAQYAAYVQQESNIQLSSASEEDAQDRIMLMSEDDNSQTGGYDEAGADIRKLYMILPAGEYTIKSVDGQQVQLTSEGMIGDIDGINVDTDSYLATEKQYNIRLPLGEYDLTGSGAGTHEYFISDDENAVKIEAPQSATVHITQDVHNISVSDDGSFDYSIRFVEFDNVFDTMELSGTAQNRVDAQLDGWEVQVSGTDTLNANVSVSNDTVNSSVSRLSGDDVTVRISDDIALGLLVDDELISEEIPLPERAELSMPGYDLASGEYNGAQTLKLSGEGDDTVIYYTTDGSKPDEYSSVYVMPIKINRSMTVRAIACKFGYKNSLELQLEYNLPGISAPTADTLGGCYMDTQYVTLRGDNTILYTLDGTDPRETGMEYTSMLTICRSCVLRAVCVNEDGAVSDELCEEYIFDRKYPVETTVLLTDAEGEGVKDVCNAANIAFTFNKYVDDMYDGKLFMAYYNVTNECIGVNTVNVDLSENVNGVILPLDIPADTTNIKIFLWDVNMTPLSEIYYLSMTGEEE